VAWLGEVADRAGALGTREASTTAVDVVDCDGCSRPVSMTATPPRTTHPVASPTIFHGIGRGKGAGAASAIATSGAPHRRHLTRPLFTFAPHAAQMTA